jgi:uncharacterized membrane protein
MSIHENSENSDTTAAAKKAKVLGPRSKGRTASRIAILLGVSVVVVSYLIYGAGGGPAGGAPAAAAATAQTALSKEISFPVSEFADGSAKFYQMENDAGLTVRYFAVKAADGSLKTAYDACDACWHAGKGYRQSGAAMICQNCRRSFEIARIGEEQGGCNPAPLKSRIREDALVIEVNDILAGSRYFDLAKAN